MNILEHDFRIFKPDEIFKMWIEMVRANSSEDGKLPFSCLRCGVCCTRHQVRLGLIEAHQIADELGLGWKEWLDLYIDRSWPGIDSFLLRHSNGACVFLEQTGIRNMTLCRIQSSKPSACREWAASLDQHDCQEGLIKQGK